MAQKVEIILVDDLDGDRADETVRYALDGVNYSIDLSAEHAFEFRELMRKYTASSRRESGRASAGRSRPAPSRISEAAQAREWARNNGYTVSARGRVQSEILEAYRKAHS